MPPPREPRPGRLVGRAVLTSVVVLAAIPLYLSLDDSWRPLVVRLVCAVLVGAVCLRVLRAAGAAMQTDTVSPFDTPPPTPPPPEMDSRFLRLRDELVFSTRNRRYFDAILWPRLCGLAGTALPRPPERPGIRRRGPSLATLEDLIARIERHA
jgi:hypothetical protein